MIAHLSGTVSVKDNNSAVIDVGGIGYLITASTRTIEALGPLGSVVKIQTDMIVREDSMTLYGFATAHEKSTFALLQTVQGVGAKAAIAILSALSPTEIEDAIMAGDKAMITRADGIGPKIATRIVNELAEKLGKLQSLSVAPLGAGIAGTSSADGMPDDAAKGSSAAINDALSALVNLGYARTEVWQVLRVISAEDSDADSAALIGAALKQLGQRGL